MPIYHIPAVLSRLVEIVLGALQVMMGSAQSLALTVLCNVCTIQRTAVFDVVPEVAVAIRHYLGNAITRCVGGGGHDANAGRKKCQCSA